MTLQISKSHLISFSYLFCLTVPVHGALEVLDPSYTEAQVVYWFGSQRLRSLDRKCSVDRNTGVATLSSTMANNDNRALGNYGRTLSQATALVNNFTQRSLLINFL
ncbi:hypothetical protein J6590_047319 [Homalodisca vitripennis]|nr:hypothetical protein J6590_047319 [Homalodisca vitripennis]